MCVELQDKECRTNTDPKIVTQFKQQEPFESANPTPGIFNIVKFDRNKT